MSEATHRLQLLYDWAAAQNAPRRLTLWLLIALLLHGGTFLLFRVVWPPAVPVRVSDAGIYLLIPGSPEAERLAPFLAASDPALFAPERNRSSVLPDPTIPSYRPSFAVAAPPLVPLPDTQPRILPPLLRDLGPVPVAEKSPRVPSVATPAEKTQIVFSENLATRAPADWPEMNFTARPGDPLPPTGFLIAVAPDGRVLHVMKDGPGDVLDDDASQYLMHLRFGRGGDAGTVWGIATFHWGRDVKRREPR